MSERAAATSQSRSPIGYFRQLWRAEVPLRRVFWQDMVVVGTTVNIAAMGLAILAVVLGASTPAGIAIHLAPATWAHRHQTRNRASSPGDDGFLPGFGTIHQFR